MEEKNEKNTTAKLWSLSWLPVYKTVFDLNRRPIN